ncbi:hypothetical protein CDAR_398911 [Caerostris darwini]|uniref:Uncharacterized protein n=1 Tax=Caerostris darwini TaxID=1538125 RepID=A0AAV4V7S0_9ARAC|nr:hypothetical protein CDAR_398911 [Caerostris darwini]
MPRLFIAGRDGKCPQSVSQSRLLPVVTLRLSFGISSVTDGYSPLICAGILALSADEFPSAHRITHLELNAAVGLSDESYEGRDVFGKIFSCICRTFTLDLKNG